MLAGVDIDTTLKILETAGEEFLIELAESLGENNLAEFLRKNQAVNTEKKL